MHVHLQQIFWVNVAIVFFRRQSYCQWYSNFSLIGIVWWILLILLIRIIWISILFSLLIVHLLIDLIALFLHVASHWISLVLSCLAQGALVVMLLNWACWLFCVCSSAIGSRFHLITSYTCLFLKFVLLRLLFCEFFGIVHFLRQAYLIRLLFDFGCTPVDVANTGFKCIRCLLLHSFYIIWFLQLFVWIRWIKLLLFKACFVIFDIKIWLELLTTLFV